VTGLALGLEESRGISGRETALCNWEVGGTVCTLSRNGGSGKTITSGLSSGEATKEMAGGEVEDTALGDVNDEEAVDSFSWFFN
jgi:hypothetical protein